MMKEFNIAELGAAADGKTNNAAVIQKAIDMASEVCGRVIVPAGRFMSGTLVLKSNVELHLEKGAVLISSLEESDILDFAKLFDDDNECTGWDGGCFLFACREKNITISGEGTIYGQGDKVFTDDGADGEFHECPKKTAEFRPRTTFFEDVEDLTVRDITIRDAAFWTLHMAGCRRVTVRDIKILNDIRGANNDGIDPDSCKDVMISGCIVETGDDAIVIKTTKPMAERYGAAENIVINNCILRSRDSGLKIGTETHGDIRNIIMSDCIMENCSRGVGIWVRDGAAVEDIHIHHITGSVLKYADGVRDGRAASWWGNGEPVFIDATYRDERHIFPGTIRNITFDHIYMKAESSIFIAGEPDARVRDIDISDIDITMKKLGTQPMGYFDEQPSERDVYPHSIPAVYMRYADNVSVTGRVRFEDPYSKGRNGICETDGCSGCSAELE